MAEDDDEAALAALLARNPRSAALYRLCEQFVLQYDNENNWDAEANGELALLRKVLPRCRVVFDVGSHVGNWAAAALAINPSLQLHCFEASPRTHQILAGRGLGVIANPIGLGARAETRPLYSFGAGNNANSLYRRSIGGLGFPPQDEIETATIDTADAYCDRAGIAAIDFMKIDTEGHELFVMQGAERLLRAKAIGAVQFEYGGTNIDSRVLLRDVFEYLSGLDYVLFKIMPDHIAAMRRYDVRAENFRFQNWLAVPSVAAREVLGG